MSTTSIGWTDLTLNPVIGCTHAGYQGGDGKKVAHPGCLNCYAEGMCSRKLPGFTGHNACSKGGKWTGEIQVLHDRLAWPFTRKEYKPRRDGKQRRCFLTSLSDMGHLALAESDWMAVQGMMLLSPWITWQDLTKRPERQRVLLEKYSPAECALEGIRLLTRIGLDAEDLMKMVNGRAFVDYYGKQWSDFAHIHRYVSVSDQPTADALIPELLKMPCAVRGVSLEPMIGPLDLTAYLKPLCEQCEGTGYYSPSTGRAGTGGQICEDFGDCTDGLQPSLLNHVIVGGESGRGRGIRPFALEWALDVIEQCKAAKVACFIKQMGSKPYVEDMQHWRDLVVPSSPQWMSPVGDIRSATLHFTGKGDNPLEWPEVLRVQQNVGDV